MPSIDYAAKVDEAARYLSSRISSFPETAIVLGTGLDGLMSIVSVDMEIPCRDIPHFPVSTVSSHAGSLVAGSIDGVPVVVLRGRLHLYEGFDAKEVTLPLRTLAVCGVKSLILTNASGSMNKSMKTSDVVLVSDHVNMMGHNPLHGPNVNCWGPRFPDMSDPYNSDLRGRIKTSAGAAGIDLSEGVYVAVIGPNLETKAEYTMLRTLGADLVGMSTVPEVLVARHMNIKVATFSVVTDECFPDELKAITLEDVLEASRKATPRLQKLVRLSLPYMQSGR